MYTNHEKYALVNGVVLDGTRDMAPRTRLAVCVDGDRIAAVCDAADVPEGYARVDLGGKYLLPGLINLHVHLPASGKPRKKPSDPKKLVKLITSNGLMRRIGVKMCEGYARTELLSGVTTIRTVGGVADFDTIIRDAARRGEILSPRVVASNMAVSVPGGHMAGSLAYEARTPEEAAAFVEKIAAEKPDLIKLMITGGVMDAEVVGEPGVLRMPVEVAAAACKAAHDMGLPVMAHVESTEGVKVALEAGVDTIEHGAPLTSEILELYRGTAGTQLEGRAPSVTCTISPALPFVLLDPEKTHSTDTQKKNGDIVCSGIIESARAALEAGVKVGLGTDSSCPFVTQYDMWREVAYFAKYVGVSNAFALHTATQVNAELLGLGGETGMIECDKAADILVTRKNPLDDLRALREPMHVMCRGDLVRKLKVKRIPEVDAELDAIMAMPAEALAEELARDGVA